MASAGTVTVDFAAETAKFTAELKKVQQSLGRMEDNFKSVEKVARVALRFFTAGALLSFAKSALTAADAMGDAAERAGLTVESFSRLQFAAGQTDVEMSALTVGIQRFQIALSNAATGTKSAQVTFARLGIEFEKLAGLSVEDQLAEVAEGFRRVTDPADRTRIAVELFGRSGAQLIPLLLRGKDGIDELTAAADRLGITLDTRAVQSIDRTAKALERLKLAASRGFANVVGGFIANTFGSGDEIADIEAKLRLLNIRKIELLTVPNSLSEQGLAQQLSVIDSEVASLQSRLLSLTTQLQASNIGQAGLASIVNIEEIDIASIQALRIEVDELGLAYQRLDQATAELRLERVNEAVQISTDAAAQAQIEIERRVTESVQQELDIRARMETFHRQQRVSEELAAEQAILNAKRAAFSSGISALQAFAGQSKKVAIALVLINKAKAIAQAIQNTAVGATLQLTTGDPYTAIARAAAVKAFGAIQIAAIVASGFGEIQAINRAGGAPIGSPSNPINTQPTTTDGQEFGATSQNAVQVIISGNVGWTPAIIDELIEGLKDATDNRDVVIFGPNSRQAQEIVVQN